MTKPGRGVVAVMVMAITVAGPLAGCAGDVEERAASREQALGGTASLKLTTAGAAIAQTSATPWALAKTGVVDAATSTVTWDITATPGNTHAGHLVIDGVLHVTNDGRAPASLGNLVVNLQTRAGATWTTRASDVATATAGDAATTARVVAHASSEGASTFTESGASGPLVVRDATTLAALSLAPETLLAPGATLRLRVTAAFDNHVLALPVGAAVRAEVIVSFGNAAGNHQTTASHLDIDGSGAVEADEARVRSVPARFGLSVPMPDADARAVTLRDALDDITTTGTVTFADAVFALGATTGTVTVRYAAGTTGGTITNCAHLTGSALTASVGGSTVPVGAALALEACAPVTIDAPICTPGSAACRWADGAFITYIQGLWTDDPDALALLTEHYFAVFVATGGVLQVGIPGAAGHDAVFTGTSELMAYLPDVGAIGPLTSGLTDPSTTVAGAFGGNLVALTLNVAYSDAGVTPGGTDLRFGDLTLCGFAALPALHGQRVRDVLALGNTLLGGGSGVYSIAEVDPLIQQLNGAFGGGRPSPFAQDHLFDGACPP